MFCKYSEQELQKQAVPVSELIVVLRLGRIKRGSFADRPYPVFHEYSEGLSQKNGLERSHCRTPNALIHKRRAAKADLFVATRRYFPASQIILYAQSG